MTDRRLDPKNDDHRRFLHRMRAWTKRPQLPMANLEIVGGRWTAGFGITLQALYEINSSLPKQGVAQ